MWRLWCRNFSAASFTPGNSVSVASAGSGQRLDQSERTITTLPGRDPAVRFPHLWMSATVSW